MQRNGDLGIAVAGGQLGEHLEFPRAELLRVSAAGAADSLVRRKLAFMAWAVDID